MFGYIRPDAPELKIKEFERFRACYCGLCHTMGDRYGITSRFFLNYDFVFLSMLLWNGETSEYCFRRCAASFCRKRCVAVRNDALALSAGYSVILTYYQLSDCVSDDKGIKGVFSGFLRAFIKRGYLKAAGDFREFDSIVAARLKELSILESENERSMDKAVDKFASLLSSAANAEKDEGKRRALEQLLYHVGRIIYIADAFNDLEEDIKARRYNPIVSRYDLMSSDISSDISEQISKTLDASCSLAAAAFELLPKSYWTPVLENIIYRGIPDMCRKVIERTYDSAQKRMPKRWGNAPGRMEKNI